MKKKQSCLLSMCAIWLCTAVWATAQVTIVNNLPNAEPGGGANIASLGHGFAQAFMTGPSPINLTAASVRLQNELATAGAVTVRVHEDNGGEPGPVIEELDPSDLTVPGNANTVFALDAKGTTLLMPNTLYWVSVFLDSGDITWIVTTDGSSSGVGSMPPIAILRFNEAGSFGGGASSGQLLNCLVHENTADSGGGVAFPTVRNSTIIHNNAKISGGGTAFSGSIQNSIIYFNIAPNFENYEGGTFSRSCTAPQPAGPGNFALDPLFVNAAANDFRLSAGSPCRDMGG